MTNGNFERVDVLEAEIAVEKATAEIELEARDVSVWFGQRKVLEGVKTL